MINFGNINTCKDAANMVLHVSRLKAQHYVRKSCTKIKIPPNSRKLYADSTLIFLKDGKNCYVPYFFGCLMPCQEDSCPKTHQISPVSRIKPRESFSDAIFFTLRAFFIIQRQGSQSTVGKEHFKAEKRAEICPRIASLSVGAIL